MIKFPKVLVVSINAWRDNTGINTLIDMFRAWNPDCVAQIYTRSAIPVTTVSTRFFQISESKVMRSVFNHCIKTGKEVVVEVAGEQKSNEAKEEEKRYKAGGHSSWMKIAREFVWLFGKWKTKELDTFVKDVNPDILFLPIYPNIYMGLIQAYIINKTGKPAICYFADDNYSYRAVKGDLLMFIHRFFLRKVVKRVIGQCKQMFVIAPKQKEEYDRIFCVNSKVITKGIDYTNLIYQDIKPHNPIRMVYTGKLIIGRWISLAAIANAMKRINRDHLVISLDIYTTDQLTEKQYKALNHDGCAVKGAVSFEEAKQIQKEADIVVFVESLNRRYKDVARLSFSTKLTDYLQACKCIFAVGSNEIAPIDYLRNEDAGIIATNEEEIFAELQRFVRDVHLIDTYGRKAFECGKRNHERKMINQLFVSEMMKVLENV